MEARVASLGSQREQTYITSHTESGFAKGTSFHNYLYQALNPLSKGALLVGFLMIWLKKCVPMHPYEVVLPTVVLGAIGVLHQIALLPAMIANLQLGLYHLVTKFMKGVTNPRVELPYTYLMTWFVLHCPMLMECPRTADVPFVQ